MGEPKVVTASLIEYPIFKVGIRDWFKKMRNIHYAGNTCREDLCSFLDEYQPDIFYLYTYENRTTTDILNMELKAYMHLMQVAVFINAADPDMIRNYIIFGVRGLLLNSIDRTEFSYANKVLYQKGLFVSKEISSLVYDTVVINPTEKLQEKTKKYSLTPRETEVMLLLYKELSKYDIAKTLNISPRTVDAHKTSIFKKLGIRGNVGLAKFIIHNQLQNYSVNTIAN